MEEVKCSICDNFRITIDGDGMCLLNGMEVFQGFKMTENYFWCDGAKFSYKKE